VYIQTIAIDSTCKRRRCMCFCMVGSLARYPPADANYRCAALGPQRTSQSLARTTSGPVFAICRRDAAPPNLRARPRGHCDVAGVPRACHACSRGCAHRHAYSDAGSRARLRPPLGPPSPRTRQRGKRRTGQAIRCQEERRYVILLSPGACPTRGPLTRRPRRRICRPGQYHLPPTRHPLVPR